MAPKKFGIFKGRSREQQEQPSTENLLQSSCADLVVFHEPSPIPSTSRGYSNENGFAEFAMLHIDNSDDEDDSDMMAVPRRVALAKAEEAKMQYQTLPSASSTSSMTLTLQDLQHLQSEDKYQNQQLQKYELPTPDDATSIDANSIQLDTSSLASEEVRYCGAKKAKKRQKLREQEMTDEEMWNVPNREVISRLLERNCSINELIKWEAIATLRGICTLSTNCTCRDCNPNQVPQAVSDGDAGIGTAPFLTAVSIGCQLQ